MPKLTIKQLQEKSPNQKLPAYSFPGGYPLLYLTEHNTVMCPDCADESLNHEEWEDFKPKHWMIYEEGADISCDECGKGMSSANGDPNEKDKH